MLSGRRPGGTANCECVFTPASKKTGESLSSGAFPCDDVGVEGCLHADGFRRCFNAFYKLRYSTFGHFAERLTDTAQRRREITAHGDVVKTDHTGPLRHRNTVCVEPIEKFERLQIVRCKNTGPSGSTRGNLPCENVAPPIGRAVDRTHPLLGNMVLQQLPENPPAFSSPGFPANTNSSYPHASRWRAASAPASV